MAKLVAKRYAEALFQVAKELDSLDKTKQEIQFIADTFKENKELTTIFRHPNVSKNDKKNIISELFGERVSSSVLNLIFITIDKNREGYITGISEEFTILSNKEQGIELAQAYTAIPMTDEETEKLQANLSKKYNKKVVLSNKVDKSIIGGVLVKLGDKIIDGSVRGRFKVFQKSLDDIRVKI